VSSRTDRPAPPSVGRLEKHVLAVANAEGVAVPRVRHWVSFMMLCGALDRASVPQGGRRCVVKGGVALELRIRGRARATQDLDVVIACEEHELVVVLDEALRTPLVAARSRAGRLFFHSVQMECGSKCRSRIRRSDGRP
jgi:hypothetical protein